MNKKLRTTKQAAKRAKKEKRNRTRGFRVVTARLACGCCTTEMLFRTEEAALAALAAWAAAGPLIRATITDDAGVVHEGVDTFYPPVWG